MNTLKIKTLVVAFLLGFSTVVSASNDKLVDKEKKLKLSEDSKKKKNL